MDNLLNIYAVVFLPLIAGLIIFCGLLANNPIIIRRFAKWFGFFYTIYCAGFFISFNTNLQFDYTARPGFYIIKELGSKLSFSQDILSALLCFVSAFTLFICLLCAKSTVLNKHRIFYSFVLFLEAATAALLCTQDFYIFICALLFEIFCVFILVSNFSLAKPQKYSQAYMGLNFFAAALLSVALGLLYVIYQKNGLELNSANLINYAANVPDLISFIAFCAFLLLSFIKLPVFGFHKPLAEIIQNSNPALIYLYICEFIIGFFVLVRFNMYAFADIFLSFAPIIAVLGIINICYFGFLALGQVELRKSFAYFCFSQTGILLVALSAASAQSICGAILLAVTLALIFCGLFLCFSFIAQIFKTSKLPLMGGLVTRAPKLAACTFMLVLIAAGIPYTLGFAAKFLCILGGFSTKINSQNTVWISTFFAMSGFLLGILYLIKVFQKAFFGPNILGTQKVHDLLRHRFMALAIICIFLIITGIIPYVILDAVSKYADMIVSSFII